jgi:transcriptional regulator with XRE-family HTH domain
MHGWEIRERRRAARLTAAQVAYTIGTSETNVAAYERGDKTPNAATLTRLLAAVDLGARSPIFVNRLLTVPAAAAAIRKGLRAGWPTRDLLRIVRETRANARWAARGPELAVFLATPSTTGDQRWDALLAGSTEDLALRTTIAPPKWTRGHALPTFWFVGENRFFDAYAFAHSPASLKVRGVMLDPSDLESV